MGISLDGKKAVFGIACADKFELNINGEKAFPEVDIEFDSSVVNKDILKKLDSIKTDDKFDLHITTNIDNSGVASVSEAIDILSVYYTIGAKIKVNEFVYKILDNPEFVEEEPNKLTIKVFVEQL